MRTGAFGIAFLSPVCYNELNIDISEIILTDVGARIIKAMNGQLV